MKSQKRQPKAMNAYLFGTFICDVVEEALKRNMGLGDMKMTLIAEYPNVEFRFEPRN